jgi:hypothetical protein
MDNSSPQQEIQKQKPNVFSAVLHVLDKIENWLTNFFELTEEELENASIHFNNQRYK